MLKKEKDALKKICEYTRMYKPLNPGDLGGVVIHSNYCHYAMEYLEEAINKLISGESIDMELEWLKENYEEFKDKINAKR